ncbi:MAG: flagellin [Alphaproteobacteria bacterium]|jgi:flagellin|nr:flagellin [Alphaproteobacteria bacterium]|tara:strand:+ start:533 stop:1357 length:825 start_codon:yes stop_codon:yes gene_type:complete
MAIQNSINTNPGSLVALRNLNATNLALGKTQDKVSTGLKVIGAKDDASSFAIAQGIRAELKGLAAVKQGLANGQGVATVAIGGATEISNLLSDVKRKIIEGLNPGNTSEQQVILNADFAGLVGQILTFAQNAEFNGRNILESGGSNVNVIADTSGGALTLRAQDLEGTVFSPLNAQNIANVSAASAALTVVNSALATLSTALGQLGADSRTLTFQDTFLTAISDATEEGLGAIVDADLAKESAKLQALQVKQQLSVQTLSIANASPQVILNLFQ